LQPTLHAPVLQMMSLHAPAALQLNLHEAPVAHRRSSHDMLDAQVTSHDLVPDEHMVPLHALAPVHSIVHA
jgi:hypothetical protein